MILLPNTGAEAGTLLAERVREAVAGEAFKLDDVEHPLPITVSIGVAEHRPGGPRSTSSWPANASSPWQISRSMRPRRADETSSRKRPTAELTRALARRRLDDSQVRADVPGRPSPSHEALVGRVAEHLDPKPLRNRLDGRAER